VKDGEDILNNFAFPTETCFVENHEFTPVLLAEPSKPVKAFPCQSVKVGNDNHSDIA
jgi:hypothetical protein